MVSFSCQCSCFLEKRRSPAAPGITTANPPTPGRLLIITRNDRNRIQVIKSVTPISCDQTCILRSGKVRTGPRPASNSNFHEATLVPNFSEPDFLHNLKQLIEYIRELSRYAWVRKRFKLFPDGDIIQSAESI